MATIPLLSPSNGAINLMDYSNLSNLPSISGDSIDNQNYNADSLINSQLNPNTNNSFLGLSNTQLNGIGTGLSGLSALGNLYNAFQANSLANKQFQYTKGITDTNLNNQIKSYNTALSDKINSRASVEGLTPQQVSSYLAANSLSRSS